MLLDRPWLGGGGRAWERLYHQYQSFWYAASETHNHFLQTAVETGVPGLLASLSLWVALLRTGWRASRPADPPGAAGPPVRPPVGAAWVLLRMIIARIKLCAQRESPELLSLARVQMTSALVAGCRNLRGSNWSSRTPTRGSSAQSHRCWPGARWQRCVTCWLLSPNR